MTSTTYNAPNANSNANGKANGNANGNGGYDMSFLGQLFTAAHDVSFGDQQKTNSNQKKQQLTSPSPNFGAHGRNTSDSSSSSSGKEQGGASPHRIDATSVLTTNSSSSSKASSSTNSVGSRTSGSTAVSHLPVEATENDECIRLCLNVSGVKPSDIKVDVQRGVLLIRGVRKVRVPDEDGGTNNEFVLKQHKFCRRFAIDTDVVDVNKIRANLTNKKSHDNNSTTIISTLTITGPKKSAPSSIQVQITENEDSGNSSGSDEEMGNKNNKMKNMKKEQGQPMVDVTPSVHTGRQVKNEKDDVVMQTVSATSSSGHGRHHMSSVSSVSNNSSYD
jgi:HSP20 family molecular chaperone IbpA